ncbi:MAG: SDR family oxidoreductase [Chloroflexi bacterium]|nr:SDR family oxidoreductase [Chloroflexota bacterium]
MAHELTGKVALVTGAGQGIGKALARGLAGAGAAVVAADVLADNALATARQIEADGGRAIGLGLDVSKAAQVSAVVERALSAFNRLDIAINNAGIFPRATVLELDEDVWDAVLDVNLKGTWLCSQAAARVMIEQGEGGRIISLASGAAYRVTPRGAHYSASKAGIVAFNRTLAAELAPYQITVNALAPGLTDTAQPRYGMSEQEIASAADTIPLGRIAQPEDMVPLVLFLCGPGGTYITGQVHHVNGGALMP